MLKPKAQSMKSILVPTDFSESANNAAHLALNIAKQASAEIHFLHILHTPVDWVKLPKEKENNYPETVKKIGHAKATLERLQKEAEDAGLKAQHFLVYDQSTDEIIKHLNKYDHDFIVMGSHGTSGVREFVIGSNTIKVVRNATVPVLVVKRKHKEINLKKIAFASEFNAQSEAPFRKVADFANIMGASLDLVYINVPAYFEESQDSREKMVPFLEKCPNGMCTPHIWNGLNEERGIVQFSREEKCDLIALATRGGTRFFGRLTTSITEGVINEANVPVLSIKLQL